MTRGFASNPSDNVRIAYEVDDGTAEATSRHRETVLFVHGSGLSKASWRGLGYVRALRDEYRVATIDLRGHGQSDRPHTVDSYSRERFLGDLEAVIDAVSPGHPVHLIGYSVGARLALELAAASPERLLSAVMLGGSSAPMRGQVGKLFFPDYLEALRVGGMSAFIEGWQEHAGRPLDASTRGVFERNDPLALAAYFERSDDEPGLSDDELRRIHTPALWIVGEHDHPRLEHSVHAATVMGARCEVLQGRNHGSTLGPAEPVIELIRPFLHEHAEVGQRS
ncbi:alpha/beta fold hydrolase [Lysinibacter cavernae]|nr:alpha/beta hydrolase [Lysinibacter cavernae]